MTPLTAESGRTTICTPIITDVAALVRSPPSPFHSCVRLTAIPPHSARATPARLRINRDRHRDRRPRRPNVPGQVEHPGPQLLAVLDPVPRAVAQDDEAMRRANTQLLLDQEE